MKKRIGNDISFTWRIYRKSGETREAEDFTGKEVVVELLSPLHRAVEIEDVSVNAGVVTFTFRGKAQKVLGSYTAVLYENRGDDEMVTLDTVEAVTLVPHSFMEEDGDEGDVIEASSVELESYISSGGGGGGAQVQSDWTQEDETAVDYIRHKPEIYTKQETNTKIQEVGDTIEQEIKDATNKLATSLSDKADKIGTDPIKVTYNNKVIEIAQEGLRVTDITSGEIIGITGNYMILSNHGNSIVLGVDAQRERVWTRLTQSGAAPARYIAYTDEVGNMPVVAVESGATVVQADADSYYEVAGEVGTLSLVLPVPTDSSKVSMVVVHLSVGASPNILIGSQATVDYSAAYEIKANKEYEINCMYNGGKWIVAGMEVV